MNFTPAKQKSLQRTRLKKSSTSSTIINKVVVQDYHMFVDSLQCNIFTYTAKINLNK